MFAADHFGIDQQRKRFEPEESQAFTTKRMAA